MMPSPWNASIKLLYATDVNTFFTIGTVHKGDPFDVVADVEVGENLNEAVDSFDLWVTIRNLSQFSILLRNQISRPLNPASNAPSFNEIRVGFNGGWNASEGDILQAVAAYKVTAGGFTDYSTAESNTFVVSI
jgi:hypothetical protein